MTTLADSLERWRSTNARLFAETEQRNAELAVINEIGEALAKQLDFQGDHRLRRRAAAATILGVRTCSIALYDRATNMITLPVRDRRWERATQTSPLRLASRA